MPLPSPSSRVDAAASAVAAAAAAVSGSHFTAIADPAWPTRSLLSAVGSVLISAAGSCFTAGLMSAEPDDSSMLAGFDSAAAAPAAAASSAFALVGCCSEQAVFPADGASARDRRPSCCSGRTGTLTSITGRGSATTRAAGLGRAAAWRGAAFAAFVDAAADATALPESVPELSQPGADGASPPMLRRRSPKMLLEAGTSGGVGGCGRRGAACGLNCARLPDGLRDAETPLPLALPP